MSKYLMTISYNGAKFYGFERQPNLRSIQGSVEEALTSLFGEKTLIKGAGRTDKGVHAIGQTVSFEGKIKDLDHFVYSINRLLPSDIVTKSVKEVSEKFDARHSSCGKIYRYDFSWGARDPLKNEMVAQLERGSFNSYALEEALGYFLGEHDFSNFTTKPTDVDNFIRNIESIDLDVDEENKTGSVTFKGNGFMTYMIRLMMGASFKAALGKIEPKEIKEMLERKPRHIVSYKAPASGLYLVEVLYNE
ncbi:MAG: tRNA pseudouridine(38-40) synthase TruA [Bacilli bacterium]|nr:tRNA pseudouridine(38-40) synthase TruA [Bacilli bacterium]